MRYAYFVDIAREADGFTVTCRDIPELVTCGDTYAEAVGRAGDALVSALSFYVEEERALPVATSGEVEIVVPPLEAAKLALHAAMIEDRISNVELGRMLDIDEKGVRRLRDPLHRSRIDQVEAALRALRRQLVVSVEPVRMRLL